MKRSFSIQEGVKVMDITPEEIEEMVKRNKKPDMWDELE